MRPGDEVWKREELPDDVRAVSFPCDTSPVIVISGVPVVSTVGENGRSARCGSTRRNIIGHVWERQFVGEPQEIAFGMGRDRAILRGQPGIRAIQD